MKLADLLRAPSVADLIRLHAPPAAQQEDGPRAGVDLNEIEIDDITDDSRRVRPGVLFAAIGTARPFLAQALALGPAAVLLDDTEPLPSELAGFSGAVVVSPSPERALGYLAAELHGRPTESLELTGVTGTNGKTSFAWIRHHALLALGLPSAMIGTLGVQGRGADGVDFSESTGYTTPRAPELQKILAGLRDRGIRRVVIEASSEGLDLGRLWGCRFACAVFTNLTRDHLDHHGTMEQYFQSKRRLFLMTKEAGGRIILCAEDEAGKRLAGEFQEAELLASDQIEAMPFPAAFQRINAGLARLSLLGPKGVRLFDDESLLMLQTTLDDAFAQIPMVPGRFNVLSAPDASVEAPQVLGIVDYAHTPDALRNVLFAVRAMPVDKLVVCIGCGGDRDPGKRAPMGAVAAELSDCVIVTDDNPRTEDPALIRAEVLRGAKLALEAGPAPADPADPPRILEVSDRREAIRAAVSWARQQTGKGIVGVVVAGKGHEAVQIFARTREPFSDTEELRSALGV